MSYNASQEVSRAFYRLDRSGSITYHARRQEKGIEMQTTDDKRIELNGGQDFLVWRLGSGNTVEILDIHVGSRRRRGIGRRLVNMMLARIPKNIVMVYAITRTENFIAQEFYEELRFRVIAPLRHFYRDQKEPTVDAIMYGYDIGGLA